MAFFTYPTLTEICRRLVSHYFLLTEEELTMWEEDPEGFSKYQFVSFCMNFSSLSSIDTIYLMIGIITLYFNVVLLF